MSDKLIDQHITVGFGMRGWYPLLVGVFEGSSGRYSEPIQTGITCKDFGEAKQAAEEWATAESLETFWERLRDGQQR